MRISVLFRTIAFMFVLLFVHGASLAIAVNSIVQPTTCGECNGAIVASAIGGTPPYTYAWSPAPGAGQGTPSIGGLCPGTYTIEVWDGVGGYVAVFIDVLAIPGLNMNGALAVSGVTAACPGQCTGQLWLNENALGGAAPYGIVTTPNMPLNAICGDTPFDLTVTDANGCSGTITTMVPEQHVPSLLWTEVIGPCGSAPTSVIAHFDVLPNFMMVTNPGGAPAPYTIMNGGVAITNGIPGVYAITEILSPPCPSNTYALFYPGIVTDCANVSGDLFVDMNSDCVNDGGDFGLPNRLVSITPGFATLSGPAGNYQRQLPDGTYDLSHTDPVYTQDCPVASPVNFSVDQFTPAVIDLAFTPGPDPDVAVTCAFGPAIVGFGQQLWLTVTNNSGVESGPITLTLDHDPVLNYCQAWACVAPPFGLPIVLPYPTSFTTGQLTWALDAGLAPGETRILSAQLCVPPDPLLLGTNFNYIATATLLLNDANLADNTCTHTETVVGSYDPNDKLARTTSGSSTEWSLENDSMITYTVRFQNTGTSPAVNVVLRDTLQSSLDLSTLKVLGGSHIFSTALNDRVLSFRFDHIMLPDSNANKAGSHGFAQFSIRPVAMSPGSSVENFADIHFDFNPPIRTNTSVVQAPLNTSANVLDRIAMSLYPNPAGDLLFLTTPFGQAVDVTIVAMDGRVMQRDRQVSDVIDVSGLAPGGYLVQLSAANELVNTRFVKQ